MTASFEDFAKLSTEELASIHWDWFKEVHGIRPRHVAWNDRESFLSFIRFELLPETQEMRREEWAREAEWLDEMEREDEEYWKQVGDEYRVQEELAAAYDDTYFDIEEKLRKA